MSQNTEPYIICPNCGNHAIDNYCSKCGQATHLHKETTWGLIVHFFEHYFHYDSKFRQTLKALWFSPGKLTLAYWNKQRARYIPPVSLYIFISFVFFFCFLTIAPRYAANSEKPATTADSAAYARSDSAINSVKRLLYQKHIGNVANSLGDRKTLEQRSERRLEAFFHFLPKMFFFMIPLMALILKVLFLKRKEYNFVDHAIFSLHIQAFFFSIFILLFINPFSYADQDALNTIGDWIDNIVFIAGLIYLIVSIHNTYDTKWPRAIVYSLLVTTGYAIAFVLVFLCYLIVTGAIAKYHIGST